MKKSHSYREVRSKPNGGDNVAKREPLQKGEKIILLDPPRKGESNTQKAIGEWKANLEAVDKNLSESMDRMKTEVVSYVKNQNEQRDKDEMVDEINCIGGEIDGLQKEFNTYTNKTNARLNRHAGFLDIFEEDIKVLKEKMINLEKELKNEKELNKKSSEKVIEIEKDLRNEKEMNKKLNDKVIRIENEMKIEKETNKILNEKVMKSMNENNLNKGKIEESLEKRLKISSDEIMAMKKYFEKRLENFQTVDEEHEWK